jgi:preprotein translocase subunit SecG
MDEQVAALLQNTLSAAASTRIQAELSLKELHKTGGEGPLTRTTWILL